MTLANYVADELLIDAVKSSVSVAGVLRFLGRKPAGGTHRHFSDRIKQMDLDTSHFTGQAHNSGRELNRTRNASNILIKRDSGKRCKTTFLRRALFEIGREYCCEKCQQGAEWLGNPMTLDVDHKNGDWLDDRQENLRFLCPNCHSQFSRHQIVPKVKKQYIYKPKVVKTPRPPKPELPAKFCLTCAIQLPAKRINYCSSECTAKKAQVHDWLTIDLVSMIDEQGLSAIAISKQYNVSDRTIRKWYQKQKDRLNVDVKNTPT